MRKIWLKERELALRTLANVGVDIVPVVQSARLPLAQPAMQLVMEPPAGNTSECEASSPSAGPQSPSGSRRIRFEN